MGWWVKYLESNYCLWINSARPHVVDKDTQHYREWSIRTKHFNTSRQKQNGLHIAENISKLILLHEHYCILFQISLNLFASIQWTIHHQTIFWHRIGGYHYLSQLWRNLAKHICFSLSVGFHYLNASQVRCIETSVLWTYRLLVLADISTNSVFY